MSRDGIDGGRATAAGLWPADNDSLRAFEDVLRLLAGWIDCFVFCS